MDEEGSQSGLEKVETKDKRQVGVTREAWIDQGSVKPMAVAAKRRTGLKRGCRGLTL